MPQQQSCHTIAKSHSDHCNMDESKIKFPSNLSNDQKVISEMGPRSTCLQEDQDIRSSSRYNLIHSCIWSVHPKMHPSYLLYCLSLLWKPLTGLTSHLVHAFVMIFPWSGFWWCSTECAILFFLLIAGWQNWHLQDWGNEEGAFITNALFYLLFTR